MFYDDKQYLRGRKGDINNTKFNKFICLDEHIGILNILES